MPVRKEVQMITGKYEDRCLALFETAGDAIFLSDDKGRFIDVNYKACKSLGYTKEEFLKLSINDIDADPSGYEAFQKLRNESTEEIKFEVRQRRKDGTLVPVEILGSYFISGKEKIYLAVARNIARRKRAEEALKQSEKNLRESEERYKILLKNGKDAIFIIQNDIVSFTNSRIEKITGYSPAQLAYKKFFDIVHPEDRDIVFERHKKRLSKEQFSSNFSYRIIKQNGETVWVQRNSTYVEWNGKPAVLNFLRDITHQKRLEFQLRQAQKMEAMGTLASGIAHDFNNILQVISGYTQLLLLNKENGGKEYEWLARINKTAQTAGELTKQILLFSRSSEHLFRPVETNRKIEHVVGLLKMTIPKMIDIEMRLSADLKVINADPVQIEQVLMNLGVNARDAMPDGGKLIIETKNVAADDEYLRMHSGVMQGKHVFLTISDTGYGMDKELQKRIFEPFYTTKKPGKETGLGLAVVYGIVQLHKGHISCHSKPGQGTVFRIYFPAIQPDVIDQAAQRVKEEEIP